MKMTTKAYRTSPRSALEGAAEREHHTPAVEALQLSRLQAKWIGSTRFVEPAKIPRNFVAEAIKHVCGDGGMVSEVVVESSETHQRDQECRRLPRSLVSIFRLATSANSLGWKTHTGIVSYLCSPT